MGNDKRTRRRLLDRASFTLYSGYTRKTATHPFYVKWGKPLLYSQASDIYKCGFIDASLAGISVTHGWEFCLELSIILGPKCLRLQKKKCWQRFNLLSVLVFPPREMEFLRVLPLEGYYLAGLAGIPLFFTWLTAISAKRCYKRAEGSSEQDYE